ncbi:baseplate J/gp47 family protein [Oligella urethralis]|uniref:baseplate assembly protein n=1 Tax=Oligella urethralis TaxID=90245 RepID=UPI000691591B|nr:baseplate J/gp47 family protein [Oligella urethralis]
MSTVSELLSADELRNLPEPDFIGRSGELVTQEMIQWYEDKSGKKVYPAQIERLLIDLMAYREVLVRIGIQEAAKQCLVAYAREPMLDYLGELVGVTRLEASNARVQLRFFVDEVAPEDIILPAGTQISDTGGKFIFNTVADAVIKQGETESIVLAESDEPGIVFNDIAVGQLTVLLSNVSAHDVQVTNTGTSSGAIDRETDDRLRLRIRLAPESFTTAGSYGAYRYHVMSASPKIVDVGITSPVPGTVNLFPLLDDGLPDDGILSLVNEVCSGERVRPLCDTVEVKAPTVFDYQINARITYYSSADPFTLESEIQAAAKRYAQDRSAFLGKDLVPSQLVAFLSVVGVYKVDLIGFDHRILKDNEWARCTKITVAMVGPEHG